MTTEFKTVTQLPELEDLQKFVGGYVQMLPLPNGHEMYVNEEGYLHQLEVNKMATAFWQGLYKTNQNILGNVMYLIKENDSEI